MAKKSNSRGGAAPATALASNPMGHLSADSTPEQVCEILSEVFKVSLNEIALLNLEKGSLRFLIPAELKTAGTVPLSSSSAVSARTATAKKAELFNNFSKVKHASIFESLKGGPKSGEQLPIQKLMSAPVLDNDEDVVGVIQVCRKGMDASCGPDFSVDDLKQLEVTAKMLGRIAFMQPADK